VENQVLTNGSYTIPDITTSGTLWTEATTTGFGVNAYGGDAPTATFGASTSQGTTKYFGITSGSPLTVASYGGPTAGNATNIAYRIAVSATQQPGTYTNTLTYVCTPTY
jgi:hypothetical protein